MNTSTIEAHIHGFIRDEILAGQDQGMLSTTPLLELRILESFALFRLVAHLNEVYQIEIGPDEIVGQHFKNIECIANLVVTKLESGNSTTLSMTTYIQPEGVAVFDVPSCAQVFVMFSGLGRDSPEFFKMAGIGNRNIILFHDASSQSYRCGVSSDLPTPAKICEWVGTWVKDRPHIEDIYCIGVSAGGPMAMIAGNYLTAKSVWVFAPRTTRRNVVKETLEYLSKFVERATGKSVRELEADMTQDDQDKIDALITQDIVDEYYKNLLEPNRFLDADHLLECVDTLFAWNGLTEHRVYYVPRDACDAKVAESLKRCPGVRLMPLEPSNASEPTWTFTRWIAPMWWVCRDHLVVELLRERGEFSKLFPDCRPARAFESTLEKDVR